MPSPVLDAILDLLTRANAPFDHVHHEPTYTTADAARVRGVPVDIGGKSLLLKVDDDFRLFVLSGAHRLDSSALRRTLGTNRIRFATPEELLELTGLVPGSVPPFGRPILPFPLAVDRSTLGQERIAFNAGSLTDSVIMNVADYLQVATIEREVDISKPP
jgi:Ala-tRNA(Pro) deacylase